MAITVEIYQMDQDGKVVTTINQKFVDVSEFSKFYQEAKNREGRNHIVVRNYDTEKMQEQMPIYDDIMMYIKNQPVYLKKMENKDS